MKKFGLTIMVLVVAGGLAGLDYWVNFYGHEPVLYSAPVTKELSSTFPSKENNSTNTSASNESLVTPPVEFSGTFPLLLAASNTVFPYNIASQQRVFDLFGIFNLNTLPGLQVIRYDMVPADSNSTLAPVQVYELHQVNQSAGITFLSLKTYLSTQVDPVNELNQAAGSYAANILFYNPIIGSENAFMLAENGLVLGFVYSKASSSTFQAIQALLNGIPAQLSVLGNAL